MKIIRKGPPWTLTTGCRKCESLLGLSEDDIYLAPNGGVEEDFGHTCWKCPVCNSEWEIKVPEYLETIARENADWNVGQGR